MRGRPGREAEGGRPGSPFGKAGDGVLRVLGERGAPRVWGWSGQVSGGVPAVQRVGGATWGEHWGPSARASCCYTEAQSALPPPASVGADSKRLSGPGSELGTPLVSGEPVGSSLRVAEG